MIQVTTRRKTYLPNTKLCSVELHKIATRPKLLPYTDMIGWALDHVDIPTRTIFNAQKVVVGYFQAGTFAGNVQVVSGA
jgi:hypothetical protein